MADGTQRLPAVAPSNEFVAGEPDSRIDVTAQLLSLEPGLFRVWLEAAKMVRTDGGMVLPCARLDPLPNFGGGRAFLSALTESSLLIPNSSPTFLRVADGRTSVLLTTYKLSGPTPAPEIHLSLVETIAARSPGRSQLPSEGLPSLPLDLLVHMEQHGDMRFPAGVWATAPSGEAAIEGFSIAPGPGVPSGILEYNAVLGQDWVSPPVAGGGFCGSRQMSLALLGVRISLVGAAAENYLCRVWGRFQGKELGPFGSGEDCQMDGVPLTGLRVVLEERG